MSVTVDHEDLDVAAIGLATVGHVLSHLQRDSRLVVDLLIDGARPNLAEMARVRAVPLAGHTLFVETADPTAVALDVLDDVDAGLDEGERLRAEVVDHLHRNAPAPALERLSGCFTVWNAAHEAIQKTTQLLRIDLNTFRLSDGGTLAESMGAFAGQLRQVKAALEDRDYVTLADVLAYEMTETTDRWRQAIDVVRDAAAGPRATPRAA